MSFWLPLAGAALGAVKANADQGDIRAQQKTQAEIARYSPWTGIKPTSIANSDPLGAAMQGGMSGVALGQNMDAASSQNEFQKQQLALQQQQANSQAGLNQAQVDYLKSQAPQQ